MDWGRKFVSRTPSARRLPEGEDPAVLISRLGPPMLAKEKPVTAALSGEWRYQVKYNGWRALAASVAGRAAIAGRGAADLGKAYPALVAAVARLPEDVVLDGEIVALDPQGGSHHTTLRAGPEQQLVVFDLLYRKKPGAAGQDLRPLTLEERWRQLTEVILEANDPRLLLAEWLPAPTQRAVLRACSLHAEGVVAKRAGSPYTPGERSSDWCKLKHAWTTALVIGGYKENPARPGEISSLLYKSRSGDRFEYVGHGELSPWQGREVARALGLTPHAGPVDPGKVHWLDPLQHVAQVQLPVFEPTGKLKNLTFVQVAEGIPPDLCRRDVAEPIRPRRSGPGQPIQLPLDPNARVFVDPVITRRQLDGYYARLAGAMVPALLDRPLRARAPRGTPTEFDFVVARPGDLLELASRGALELRMSTRTTLNPQQPDWMVFDLDPGPGADLGTVTEVAQRLKLALDRLQLPSLAKTSGLRGLHVMVPIAHPTLRPEVSEFAHQLARLLELSLEGLAVGERTAPPEGSVVVRTSVNGPHGLLIAPYSPRAASGAPVSTPLEWAEVTPRLDPAAFTLKTLPGRLDKLRDRPKNPVTAGDLFAATAALARRLPRLTWP